MISSRRRPLTGTSPTRSIVSPGRIPAASAGPPRRTPTTSIPAGTALKRTPTPPNVPLVSSASALRSSAVK
jgi:hypothetical protein